MQIVEVRSTDKDGSSFRTFTGITDTDTLMFYPVSQGMVDDVMINWTKEQYLQARKHFKGFPLHETVLKGPDTGRPLFMDNIISNVNVNIDISPFFERSNKRKFKLGC
jgi:hypothetical protein